MKPFILLISSFLLISGKPQFSESGKIHATVVVAAILKDSIIMVADTRASIQIGNKSIIAGYVDSIPKIFQIKDYIIASRGYAAIGADFIGKIVSDFNKSNVKKSDFRTTILDFQDYLDVVYPISKFAYSKDQQFYAAGFFDNHPELIGFNRSDSRASNSKFKSEGVLASDNAMFPFIHQNAAIKESLKTIQNVFVISISQYAKETNKALGIGGPITIVNVLPGNNIRWIKNDFRKRQISSVNTFVYLIKKCKITFKAVIPNGKNLAIKTLEKDISLQH